MDHDYNNTDRLTATPVVRAAFAAHEMNRLFCLLLGDDSQKPWDQAPEWQKASAVAGVKAIEANPKLDPAQSHRGWMEHKLNDGWRYGPEKDEVKKEHPCLVPYEDLPPAQQVKDAIFGAVVRAVLSTSP